MQFLRSKLPKSSFEQLVWNSHLFDLALNLCSTFVFFVYVYFGKLNVVSDWFSTKANRANSVAMVSAKIELLKLCICLDFFLQLGLIFFMKSSKFSIDIPELLIKIILRRLTFASWKAGLNVTFKKDAWIWLLRVNLFVRLERFELYFQNVLLFKLKNRFIVRSCILKTTVI